jgi:hypothetical protein
LLARCLFFSSLLVLAVIGSGYGTELGERFGKRALGEYIGSPMRVLYIAMQPGDEDLSVVSYYARGLGARTRVAFLTNGELTEDGQHMALPHERAAARRLEAVTTLDQMETEAYFLNMPDVASASDSLVVRSFWNADSLRARCRVLIRDFMPDLILLARERSTGDSLRTNAVRADVLAAVHSVAQDTTNAWRVSRVAIEQFGGAVTIRVDRPIRSGQPTPRSIADSVGSSYSTMTARRAFWSKSLLPSFSVLVPPNYRGRSLEAGIPGGLPPNIRLLESAIQSFKQKLARGASGESQRDLLLRELRRLLDSVDVSILRYPAPTSPVRRVMLDRKAALEKVRNELLGVSISMSVSDTIVTDRQVIELVFKEVKGISASGTTEVFVPAVDEGWILNEDVQKRVPLEIGKEYRLLSPASVQYDYPPSLYGLTHALVRKPLYVFVIHRSKDRSRSFTWRSDLRLWYAPRFTTEVLTPIVRAMNDEKVVVRLTNHSRDGVSDSVYVRDSLVTAPGRMFRLPGKGTTHTDTLTLFWSTPAVSGDHVVDVLIGGIATARFVARGFAANTDLGRRVAVVSAAGESPTLDALRRLGYLAVRLEPEAFGSTARDSYDVVVVDPRVVSSDGGSGIVDALASFAERSGHVVVLTQASASVARMPMFAGLHLRESFRLDERTPVELDTQHVLMRRPNSLSEDDFSDWLTRRAYHAIRISGDAFEVPVRNAATGDALVATRAWGKGRATYVDLALVPQWMNVHAGALRLLANLVAMH